MIDGNSSKRTIDLETIADDRRGDELVLGNIIFQFIDGLLVENNFVLQFVLDASLGRPFLFLLSTL